MRPGDARAIEEFWQIVVRCMEELFETPSDIAKQKCLELRDNIEVPMHDTGSIHTFYHAEPIDVAMDLAKKTELAQWQKDAYKAIQKERMKGLDSLSFE